MFLQNVDVFSSSWLRPKKSQENKSNQNQTETKTNSNNSSTNKRSNLKRPLHDDKLPPTKDKAVPEKITKIIPGGNQVTKMLAGSNQVTKKLPGGVTISSTISQVNKNKPPLPPQYQASYNSSTQHN